MHFCHFLVGIPYLKLISLITKVQIWLKNKWGTFNAKWSQKTFKQTFKTRSARICSHYLQLMSKKCQSLEDVFVSSTICDQALSHVRYAWDLVILGCCSIKSIYSVILLKRKIWNDMWCGLICLRLIGHHAKTLTRVHRYPVKFLIPPKPVSAPL